MRLLFCSYILILNEYSEINLSHIVYERDVISDPELLPELENYIVEIAKTHNVPEEKINNLALSFSEAASNGMSHGNRLDKEKKINIKVVISDSEFLVKIKDQGKGFKLDEVPDPTKLENILKDSGRGIHIMKSFLDGLTYNITPSGTEVSLSISLK